VYARDFVSTNKATKFDWNLELGTWNLELGTWNLELGTWNLELGNPVKNREN
jgi:hypothetical protein